MANFKTHFYVGIFVSGGTVLALKGMDLVPPGQTLVLFGLGVTGSVLPDIDADISSPGRAFFGVLGAVLAFGWTLPLVGHYRSLELAVLWFALFLVVRFLLFEAFARFTVHRGIWHSLLAVVFVTLATVNLSYRLLEQPPRAAWVAGLMMGIGYLTHLCLDEIYSVDLFNRRLRRSFGTALKPFSLNYRWSSLAMAAAVGGLAWAVPAADFTQLPRWVEVLAWVNRELLQLAAWSDQGVAAVRAWLP